MGELVWDERLITRAEALELPAGWPVRPGHRADLEFLDCGKCGQAMLQLGTIRKPFTTTPEQISQATLRHMVSGHGVPLNHRRERGPDGPGTVGQLPGDEQAATAGGRVPARVRPDRASGRHAPETAGSRGEPAAPRGDPE